MSDTQVAMTPREIRDMHRFLELLRVGVGPLNAAVEIGWSPTHLKRLMADPEVVEMVEVAQERRLESHEQVLNELAAGGHFKALQMVLHNERPTRWRDTKHIQIAQTTTVDIGVVHSVKTAALELLREQGVAALQQPIDVESRESGD